MRLAKNCITVIRLHQANLQQCQQKIITLYTKLLACNKQQAIVKCINALEDT